MVLKEERLSRVTLVKNVIYMLHLARTDHSCLRNGSRVLQAYGEGSHYLTDVLSSKEDSERLILEGHEAAARGHLMGEILPWMMRLATVLHSQRRALCQLEQEARHDVFRAELESFEKIQFKRSVLRHTEQVVTQLNREDHRVAAINEKMEQLGYRSLKVEEEVRGPSTGVASPLTDPRVDVLQADTAFLETHIIGLRTLRVIEEEKLHNAREDLKQTDELLRLKQSLLQPYASTHSPLQSNSNIGIESLRRG